MTSSARLSYCRRCGRWGSPTARFCRRCGTPLAAMRGAVMPPPSARSRGRQTTLGTLLALVLLGACGVGWSLSRDAAGSAGGGGALVQSALVSPGPGLTTASAAPSASPVSSAPTSSAAPAAPTVPFRSSRFPGYGITLYHPASWEKASVGDLARLAEIAQSDLDEAKVDLVALWLNQEDTGGVLLIADREPGPDMSQMDLKMTGELIVRDAIKLPGGAIKFHAETLAGRPAFVSDMMEAPEGGYGRGVVIAGPHRLYYLVAIGETKQVSENLFRRLREGLARSSFDPR